MVDVAALRSFQEGDGLASNQLKWLTDTFYDWKRILYVRKDNLRAYKLYEHLKWVDVEVMTSEYEFFRPKDKYCPYKCMTNSAQ